VNIFEGSPKELEHWFQQTDTRHLLMCFLVAPRAEDRTLFKELIDEVVHMDNVLGEQISFILFREPDDAAARPGISLERYNDRYGNYATVMAGEILGPSARVPHLPRVLDELYDVRTMDRAHDIQDLVVKSSHKIVPALCDHFELPFDELPAIIVLAKGLPERFLFPLRKQLNYKDVLDFVMALAAVLSETGTMIEAGTEMRERVRRLETGLQMVETRRQQIAYAVEGVRRKYGLDEQRSILFFLRCVRVNPTCPCDASSRRFRTTRTR